MSASNINVVVITGNLTRDPELRHTESGTPICKLRVAVNGRRKTSGGEWIDRPNYFDVTVWGAQGENCSNHLVKGRPVAIEGRLEWREWETEGGARRQAVEIVASQVQFLGKGPKKEGAEESAEEAVADRFASGGGSEELAAVGGGVEEDIPF